MLEDACRSSVTLSVVSHGHGDMVWRLVNKLSNLESVVKIIVTLNIPEKISQQLPDCVQLIHNLEPMGFGENHNQAFASCNTKIFGVINPDIDLIVDPFPVLLDTLADECISVVGPKVVAVDGTTEDSLRRFPTLISLMSRYLLPGRQETFFARGDLVFPDWIAGMFMLFKTSDYQRIGGFNTNYFMYCEDADICTRLWLLKKWVALNSNAVVVHQARRASRRSLRHLLWHIASLIRYQATYFRSLPSIPKLMA